MTEDDLATVIEEFAAAAAGAVSAGFDAVELHLGHGYLLSQFISPATNRRRDRWGGSLGNRMRLPLAVVERVRAAVPPGFPILAKTNLRDGFRGGLDLAESIGVAQRLEAAGVSGLVLCGGFTSRTPFYLFRGPRPLKEMIDVEKSWPQKLALRLFGSYIIREYPFTEMLSHERHVTFQHIDELRQFVEARLPQELSNGGNSWVILDLEARLLFAVLVIAVLPIASVAPAAGIVCLLFANKLLDVVLVNPRVAVGIHGPELQERERAAILSHPLLLEKHRPFRGLLDEDRYQDKERSKEQKAHNSTDDVGVSS